MNAVGSGVERTSGSASQATMVTRLRVILGFLVACGVLGLVVMITGIVPIKASSGHWAITKWVLDFSKSRSVAFHSRGIDPPSLDDPALVMKGAGHYETGCVQCHGSPTRPASPIALAMTATPPALPSKIAVRQPAELFYIVKHGIKFTGMPAWPAPQRDDEVWALVAFLLELPQMDAARYRELTSDSAQDPMEGAEIRRIEGVAASTWETCTRCHGSDGLGRGAGVFPKLAGQKPGYLRLSLQAYANGDRHSGIMQPVAAVLSEDELDRLADHFASLSAGSTPADDDQPSDTEDRSEAIARGRSIATEGIPDRNVPSCADCHDPGEVPTAKTYPRLAGQYADYLVLQLELFQAHQRGGTSSAHLMEPAVNGLTTQDMEDVATYYASLSSE